MQSHCRTQIAFSWPTCTSTHPGNLEELNLSSIEDYFGDGSEWWVDITYPHEEQRLGTAGPLSLLPEQPDEPLVVMNGDLLTKLSFAHLLDYYRENDTIAAMCVREHETQVPYGVIETDDQYVKDIEEKTTESKQLMRSVGL